MSRPRLAAFAFSLVSFATSVSAAEITPDQAAALEGQLRAWVAGMAGPNVNLPERPIEITPAGDHYAVAIPIKIGHTALQLTAAARPLEGGKWAIDDMRFPSPVTFTADNPQTMNDDGKPNPMSGPVTYNLNFGQQSGQALFDPSYASPSTLNSSMQNFDLAAIAEHGQIKTHIDRSSTTSILRPTASGRVDVLTDGSAEGYQITANTGDANALRLAIGRVRVTGEMNNLSRERGVQIVQALAQLVPAVQSAAGTSGGKSATPKLDPKTVEIFLDALADFASGFSFSETIEHLSADYGDSGGTLSTTQIGLAAKTDQGLLQAHMDLGLEGLALHDLPIDDMQALVPTRIALRPAVSGLSVADLTRLLKDSEDGKTPPDADISALFSHGGVSAGLESFAIDVAGASFTGMGKLLFTGPTAFGGTAQITATKLDLLQQRVAANPVLAQALPLFIFAKGIGRMVQNQIVWDVSYRGGQLLINDQDMSSMMGGGGTKSPPAAGQGRPVRPNRTR